MAKTSIDQILASYALILEKTQKFFASKKEILDYLETHDLIKDERSLLRYLAELRLKGITFEEKRENRKVLYRWVSGSGDRSFLKLMETMYYSVHLPSPLDNKASHIIYEEKKQTINFSMLKEIDKAITLNQAVYFDYLKFGDHEAQNTTVSPYLLKQYNALWYVIGYNHKRKAVRTYALDRITKWKGLSSVDFEQSSRAIVREQINHCIGVSLFSQKPEHVILETPKYQWPYLEASPYHWSQKKIEETTEKVIFSLDVVNNYEFRQKIFWGLGRVKVVSPESVVQSLKTEEKPYID